MSCSLKNNKEPFWSDDPLIIVKKDYLLDCIPRNYMTLEQRINALVRMSLYITIILILLYRKAEYVWLFIAMLISSVILYDRASKTHREGMGESGACNKVSHEKPLCEGDYTSYDRPTVGTRESYAPAPAQTASPVSTPIHPVLSGEATHNGTSRNEIIQSLVEKYSKSVRPIQGKRINGTARLGVIGETTRNYQRFRDHMQSRMKDPNIFKTPQEKYGEYMQEMSKSRVDLMRKNTIGNATPQEGVLPGQKPNWYNAPQWETLHNGAGRKNDLRQYYRSYA